MSALVRGYTDVAAALTDLPALVTRWRAARGLTLRETAAEMGVAPSTILRIESGKNVSLSNAATMLRWLNTGPMTSQSAPSEGAE